MLVIVDFGSYHRAGDKLTISRGTREWIDGGIGD